MVAVELLRVCSVAALNVLETCFFSLFAGCKLVSTVSCLSISSCGGGVHICALVSSLSLVRTVRVGCLLGSLGLGTLLFGLILHVAGGALTALTAFFLITLVGIIITTAGQRGRTLVVCLLVVVACRNDLDNCSRTAAFHVALFERTGEHVDLNLIANLEALTPRDRARNVTVFVCLNLGQSTATIDFNSQNRARLTVCSFETGTLEVQRLTFFPFAGERNNSTIAVGMTRIGRGRYGLRNRLICKCCRNGSKTAYQSAAQSCNGTEGSNFFSSHALYTTLSKPCLRLYDAV